jgi:signal transduction histidine kinase
LDLLEPLRRLFNRLSFRTKFVVVGLAVAGPISTLAVFAATTFEQRVQQARERVEALHQASTIRELAGLVAVHRGLSAQVLAGAEGESARLVEHQRRLFDRLSATLGSLSGPAAGGTGLPDADGLLEELRALASLPDTADPQRNFLRHGEVIDALLAALSRTGVGLATGLRDRDEARLYDLTFVTLPALAEDLGRQRGWGSAVLALRQFSAPELTRFLLHAGGTDLRLGQIRADRHTLRELDRMLGNGERTDSLMTALNEAEIFSQRSIDRVMSRDEQDDAASVHFADGSSAIERLGRVNARASDLLLARSDRALAAAERGRALSFALLGAVVLTLGLVYWQFERSTVLRLNKLASASRRLAQGEFETDVRVDGTDEIAALGASLDRMRQRLREAVAEQAGALAAQESNRVKTEFLARWSHDLRTPLAAVLGFTQVLAERDAERLTTTQRDDLGRIRAAADHLLQLVNDVLALATLEAREAAVELRPVDLAQVVSEAIDLTGHVAAAASVQVEPAGAAAAPAWVQADRTRLLQALINLLDNAIKHNRAGGWVRVELVPGPQRTRVTVIDSGAGLTPEQVRRLFRPFERLDAAERGIAGSGLGLTTAQRLAEAMAGTVGVDSTPGIGSRFWIDLPTAEPPLRGPDAIARPAAPALPERRAPGPADAASDAVRRIVYVEDDETNVVLFQAMLARIGVFDLTVFGTAAQALEATPAADLWIIDRRLPDGDGIELLGALRQRIGPVRAVLFSADALPSSRERAVAAGYHDVWVKPIGLEPLREALGRVMA